MKNIFILNGPNLNLLGTREPEIYGTQTLHDIEMLCEEAAKNHGASIDFRQSNHEGEIVEAIHDALNNADAIIINAGAYTHTSVAIHDALKMFAGSIIEVHISAPHKREKFRHHSYITPLATAVIQGKGTNGYVEAIEIIAKQF